MALGATENVKGWLRTKKINVLDEWVEACVEWIDQEQQGPAISGSQLCEMVYEQWLDSDLSEIATPCLPPSIGQAKSIRLGGGYVLQVNSVQDISSPAYGQLVKLQGRENENASVSAAPPTQGKYEPKPSRLLMLSLTDGQQLIQAMEYKPVPCLHPDLAPGTKIFLSGDMSCRLGVILLTPAHVKVLGGEVEALKEANSQEQLLARAIGVPPPPERPLGGSDQGLNEAVVQVTPVNAPVTDPPRNNNSTNATNRSWNQPSNNGPWNRQTTTGSAQAPSQRPRPKQEVNSGSNVGRSLGHGVQRSDEEGFLDDEEGLDELMLEEIEMIEKKHQVKQVKQEACMKDEEVDWDADDINEEELLAMEWESGAQPPRLPLPAGMAQRPPGPATHNPGSRTSSNRPDAHGTTVAGKSKVGQPSARQGDSDRLRPLSEGAAGSSISGRGKDGASRLPSSKSGVFVSNAVPLFRTGTTVPGQPGRLKVEQRTSTQCRPASDGAGSDKSSKTDLRNRKEDVVPRLASSKMAAVGSTSVSVAGSGSTSSKMAAATRLVKEEPLTQQHSSTPSSGVCQREGGLVRDSVKLRGHCSSALNAHDSPKRRKMESETGMRRPFIYLINMADQLEKKEACRFDIKGFIMTLVSSLSHSPTWSLTAKINDGTMSLDVDISEQVLTQLIGFTVKEMMEMKAELKRSDREKAAEIKTRIRQGISQCQQSLIELSCIMTVEMQPGYVRPKMAAIRHPTRQDAQMLLDILTSSGS